MEVRYTTLMYRCPTCQATAAQIKDGLTGAGSQRVRCRACSTRYTAQPKSRGYDRALRTQALKLYVDGMNFRRIARQLAVHHQTVINWINAAADRLPNVPPQPAQVDTVELDELDTFVGNKKSVPIS